MHRQQRRAIRWLWCHDLQLHRLTGSQQCLGAGGNLDRPLSYFPATAPAVAVVTTDLDDIQWHTFNGQIAPLLVHASVRTLLHETADHTGLSFGDDFKALLGNPLVIGLLSGPATGPGRPVVAALQVRDAGRLPRVLRALGFEAAGSADGARLYRPPLVVGRRLAPAMGTDIFRPYFEPNKSPAKDVWWTGLGYFMALGLFNAYPLPQDFAGMRRALNYTGDLIRRGYCPLVFPEGERTPDGSLHAFRPGIGMMAIRLGVPVVPIRIEGLYETYSVRDSWPRRGPVRVSFGQPHEFSTETYENAAQQLHQAVQALR